MPNKVLTATQRRLVLAVLLDRFPLLGTDEEIDGADTVDALNRLHADLGDTKQFFSVDVKRKKAGKAPKPTTDERFARVTQPGTPESPADFSYMVTGVATLNAAIRQVVDYAWDEERNDYIADENESRDAHIFNHLVALDNWLEGTDNTPMSHVHGAGDRSDFGGKQHA